MSIGTIIRKLRRERDITQKDLGKAVGVAESTISLYETGRNIPDLNMMRKLAIFFNVSLDYLADNHLAPDIVNETAPEYKAGWDFNTDELELIARYRKLSALSKQTLLTLLDNLESMEKAKNEQSASEVS